jgi:peptidoglycan/xylan/chitin deacetylase (PgdA/CDA1 family)
MSGVVRSLGLSLSRRCGVQRLLWLRSRGPVVLFYHGVVETILDPEVQGLHLPLRVFEKQMHFLLREREVISLDDLHHSLSQGNSLNSRQVVLTFDDGYRNNLSLVAPLLKALNLPFTIFVSTRQISEARRFPMYQIRTAILYTPRRQMYLNSVRRGFDITTRDRRVEVAKTVVEVAKKMRQDVLEWVVCECQALLGADHWVELNAHFASDAPMSWDEVVQVRSMGATIGSHTHDHCILHANQSREEVYWQLIESKRAIERIGGVCRYLAYPNGGAADVSVEARAAAESAQFAMAFSTVRGEVTVQSDLFLLPRMFAVPDFEEFCFQLNRSASRGRPTGAVTGHARPCTP